MSRAVPRAQTNTVNLCIFDHLASAIAGRRYQSIGRLGLHASLAPADPALTAAARFRSSNGARAPLISGNSDVGVKPSSAGTSIASVSRVRFIEPCREAG